MYSNQAIFATVPLVVAIATRAAIGEIINKKISIINTGKAWVGEGYKTITKNAGDIIGYSSSDGM
ncbi:hypothetical protein [Clostridium sp. LP20]|uniref:hypothetical protein n=1 Tax=Clostridium sp. LP20 TaxID=3418665 RepID=UPI003EE7029E